MRILRRFLGAAALLVTACSFASANSIIQSFSAPVAPQGDTTDWSQVFSSSISQYNLDPSLFTLNDIKITIAGTATASGQATNANDNGSTTNYTFAGITKFEVSADGTNDGSLLFGVVETDQLYNTSFGTLMTASVNNSVTYAGTFNASNGGLISCTPVVSGGVQSNPLTCGFAFDGPGLSISQFVGSGFVNFDVGGLTRGGFQGSSFTSASLGGTADLAVTVQYDYSPAGTPEPATMALMGGALVGVALIGKRFRRNR